MIVCISPLQKPDFHACLHTKICSELCFSKSGPLALGGTDRRGHSWGKDGDWRVTATENIRRKRWRLEARYWKRKARAKQGQARRSRGEGIVRVGEGWRNAGVSWMDRRAGRQMDGTRVRQESSDIHCCTRGGSLHLRLSLCISCSLGNQLQMTACIIEISLKSLPDFHVRKESFHCPKQEMPSQSPTVWSVRRRHVIYCRDAADGSMQAACFMFLSQTLRMLLAFPQSSSTEGWFTKIYTQAISMCN